VERWRVPRSEHPARRAGLVMKRTAPGWDHGPLARYLDSNFRANRRVAIGSLVRPVKSGALIPAGSLVVMASGDRRLRLKLLEREATHRNFSEPLVLNGFATEHKVTPHYLLWYLSRDEVANYLLEHATGTVFIRVPRTFLHSVPVPLPTTVTHIKAMTEFAIVQTSNPFSKLIGDLYSDYRLNVENRRFRTAAVLAGAICEVILYQMLLEQGVSKTLLKNDRGLAFGKLLDYTRVLKLDQAPGFPISQLVELQRSRNEAIHAGLLVNQEREMTASDLQPFEPIIRYFGI
jgi:hypothetical protein